jgi:cytoskeleton protein RodZ
MEGAVQMEPDVDFGSRLKRLREQRGVTLRQIAETTKISIGALEALERNDISRLPGGIFSRAFVRAYATEIGIDPEATVREFIQQFPHESVTAGVPPAMTPHEMATVPPSLVGRKALMVAAILLPIAAIVVWSILARLNG